MPSSNTQPKRRFVTANGVSLSILEAGQGDPVIFVHGVVTTSNIFTKYLAALDRRDLVWVNVTTNPTAEWIAHQLTEAFPWNEASRYRIRDTDQIYDTVVTRRMRAMGIRDKPTAPASPWQNGFAERLIGSIRRECVDHYIVLGEAHLRRICVRSPLQRHQNASVIGQRCAGLSLGSADRIYHFTRDSWQPSSSLCAGLGFRYTQAPFQAILSQRLVQKSQVRSPLKPCPGATISFQRRPSAWTPEGLLPCAVSAFPLPFH